MTYDIKRSTELGYQCYPLGTYKQHLALEANEANVTKDLKPVLAREEGSEATICTVWQCNSYSSTCRVYTCAYVTYEEAD